MPFTSTSTHSMKEGISHRSCHRWIESSRIVNPVIISNVGDWEHNMIRFKEGKPTGIYFSAHGGGEACDWGDEACLSKQGDRPVVFSARGSHANYPSEGHHTHDEALIDLTDKGRIWDPIKPAYFYKYDPATDILTAAEPGTDPTDWFHFNGAWGDKKYADTDPRQKTVPYFGLEISRMDPRVPSSSTSSAKGSFQMSRRSQIS